MFYHSNSYLYMCVKLIIIFIVRGVFLKALSTVHAVSVVVRGVSQSKLQQLPVHYHVQDLDCGITIQADYGYYNRRSRPHTFFSYN